jgi:hypothetical protein
MNTQFEKKPLGICLVLVIFFVAAGGIASSDRTLLLAGDPAKGGSTHHAAPRDAMIAALAISDPILSCSRRDTASGSTFRAAISHAST